MGSSPSPPAAPDPTQTADAQTASNQATALYQSQLNNVNQVTPYGNETFTQSGGSPAGADGTGAVAPTWTSNITLSPAEQALLNNQQSLQTQQQGIAGTALQQAQSNQATPYNLGGLPQLASASNISDATNAGYQDVLSLIQPQMTQNDELLQSQLANQGVTQGSAAYNNAEQQHQLSNNQAYANAALTGVSAGQALQQEALTNNQQAVADYTQQYNAPINEYQALQNGVQVQNPSFAAPQSNTVAPTNTAQIAQNAYQAQLNSYNAANSSSNSLMGSLFGLGGSFLGASSGSVGGGIASGISNLFGPGGLTAAELAAMPAGA